MNQNKTKCKKWFKELQNELCKTIENIERDFGSKANAIDDVMPNAMQETWDRVADINITNPSFFGAASASGRGRGAWSRRPLSLCEVVGRAARLWRS